MKRALAFLFFTSTIVGSASMAYAQHATMDDKELMSKLKEAAPAHVLEHATVMNMGHDGAHRWMKEGAQVISIGRRSILFRFAVKPNMPLSFLFPISFVCL